MNSDGERNLRRILLDVGISEADFANAEWWIHEEQEYGTPVVQKALFLRESWRAIVRHDARSVDDLISAFDRRKGDNDSYYTSRLLRKNPKLLTQMKGLVEAPDTRDVLNVLIRAAQINVLAEIARLLDGGFAFEDGLAADWALCSTDDLGDPIHAFGDISQLMWLFDPDRNV